MRKKIEDAVITFIIFNGSVLSICLSIYTVSRCKMDSNDFVLFVYSIVMLLIGLLNLYDFIVDKLIAYREKRK